MASPTKVIKIRRKMKAAKRGRKRKLELKKHGTTPSREVFFGDAPKADKAG